MPEYLIDRGHYFAPLLIHRPDYEPFEWPKSTVQDRRDNRDPGQLGALIRNRPKGFTASEYAELVEGSR